MIFNILFGTSTALLVAAVFVAYLMGRRDGFKQGFHAGMAASVKLCIKRTAEVVGESMLRPVYSVWGNTQSLREAIQR